MCGIAGVWTLGSVQSGGLESTARRMADALAHRGPDSHGIWTDPADGVALAHRRLAIVDLSPAGHQPMVSALGRYVISYNGEIYNHAELRRAVAAAGGRAEWNGHSDTETLLAAIELWGFDEALRRAVGMFAIALWDRRDKVLSFARDRLGEKPLYYGWVGRALAFGSELKALRVLDDFDNPIDIQSLSMYTRTGNVPAPRSIYSRIFKLPPASILTVSLDELRARELGQPAAYWSAIETAERGTANPEPGGSAQLDELETRIRQAIAGQMMADVPLGAFLSGGVDSSLVVALMQAQSSRPVRTFTIGFDEAGFDESPYAATVAKHLGTDHTETRVSARDAMNVIPQLPTIYDEPFADSSQIPTFLVCKTAREHVTVALSGDGGDELFGGYNRYFWGDRIWKRLGWMPAPVRKLAGSALLAIPAQGLDRIGVGAAGISMLGDKAHKVGRLLKEADSPDGLYHSLVTQWPDDAKLVQLTAGEGSIPSPPFATPPAAISESSQRMMLWDTVSYLPDDILTKVDRAAMHVALETRVPLLDHRVVEYAWRLPVDMKLRNNSGKWALRQILYRYVPEALIERPKAGFAVPVGVWMRGPLRDWIESLLDSKLLREQGFFNPILVRQKWEQHLSGRSDWTAHLWSILMFQGWLEKTRQ